LAAVEPFQSLERHLLFEQWVGCFTTGIHSWPQTSQWQMRRFTQLIDSSPFDISPSRYYFLEFHSMRDWQACEWKAVEGSWRIVGIPLLA
jgi:hypothetical protein